MTDKDKSRDEYYKGEDWVKQGDGYVRGGSPHLNELYQCMCGGEVLIHAVLKDMGELVEVLVQCSLCSMVFVVMAGRRDIRPFKGKKGGV